MVKHVRTVTEGLVWTIRTAKVGFSIMKRRNNDDDILLPTGFMHRVLERDRERQRAEESDEEFAEIERVLAACPDTFIFYSKG